MTKDEITVVNFLKGEDIFSTGKITSRTNIPILYNNKKAILKVDGEMWRISDFLEFQIFGEFQIFENFRFLRISDF